MCVENALGNAHVGFTAHTKMKIMRRNERRDNSAVTHHQMKQSMIVVRDPTTFITLTRLIPTSDSKLFQVSHHSWQRT